MKGFADLADLPEDQRIESIGAIAMRGATVGFVVDVEGADGFAKADRYITKLLAKYPSLKVLAKVKGPTKEMITVKVGL